MHPHHTGGWGPKAAVLGLVLVAILGVAGLYRFRTAREQWATSEFREISRKLNISESDLSLIIPLGAREYEVSFNRDQCSALARFELGSPDFESWRSSVGFIRSQEEPLASIAVPHDGVLTRESWREVRLSHSPLLRPAMKIGTRNIVSVDIYYSEDKGMVVVSILGR